MKNSITDIFFDLDDTLINLQKSMGNAFENLFQSFSIPVEKGVFLREYASVSRKYWTLYREKRIKPQALHLNRFDETFEKLGVSETQALQFDDFRVTYTENLLANLHLFPETLATLDYLTTRYRLHIITDGLENLQRRKLEKSGLSTYFTTVVCSDEVGETKPNPRIFEEALQRANTKKESSVMIGDHLRYDVEGAANNGLSAIYFNPKGAMGYTGKHIHQLNELKTYF